jgi:hypothetical protein
MSICIDTPQIVATADLTGQSAPSTVTAFTTSSAGFYRVSWNVESTSGVDVFSAHAEYTDSVGSKVGGSTEAFPNPGVSSQVLFAAASTAINVVLTNTSTTNFNLHIRVEQL